MSNSDRRSFIKKITAGTAASLLIPQLYADNKERLKPLNDYNANDSSEAFWETVKAQFHFAHGLYYFNNGSLGPSPMSVQGATNSYRATLDGFPSRYMWGEWQDEKEKVRLQVAHLFSVNKEEIAITHNTTEGMNLIAKSIDLKAGDEVILSNHDHASAYVPWEVWQETKGIKLVRPKLPLLPKTIEDIVAVYENAITPKTKVINICHIVNTNGMLLPVKEISEMAHKKGILVAVDGAQTAGMFTINLKDLGCDFYTASAHKWLFSPKGIAVFYAKQESQKYLKPLIVARGHKDKSVRRLENYNTRNLPEYLGLGDAVAFHNAIGGEKITKRSYALKHYFRDKVKANPKFKLKTPENDQLSCAIQTLEVIGKPVSKVKKQLFDNYSIDTRPMSTFGLNGVRISFGIYITKKDIDYLVNALETIAG
ncbi:aminotransferase class V-fold PLP-dependent enzyme [Winogradskyella haliclonae]|uniref:Pyoverdine biosynthesis protein PvdN n=1 Tax=Winogradskyella haliclonae TaxID=2048558 RepID=A0ABQ2C2A7_9FLAO|nr:aminotransferase class V-fold PLP-dependent enzyme [Winogradskyella haliclonae]GGI57248.1 pyoverdine biosynthesis protein PvdN [Winogradskyella haliclonae]